jgi:hypothetical protein
MQLTLTQFEAIDSLMASILRMGPFETCADPRGYIKAEQRLFFELVDAIGYKAADAWPDALEAAADIVAGALLGTVTVLDEEAA